MNACVDTYRDEMDASYAVDFGRDREPLKKRSTRPEYRRRSNGPVRVNGIHCRRSKRWTWGSGRGARMVNVRAFAGSMAFLVANVAASCFGITIDWSPTISQSSTAAPNNGLGVVSAAFKISKFETTTQQYAEFLNNTTVGKNDQAGVWNASTGITRTGTVGSYSYTATDPTKPIATITWWSAARFANWLNNGGTNGSATETGAYNFTTPLQVSGTMPTRNPSATVFLPSANEWFKAAYWNPVATGYNNYGSGTSATITASSVNAAGNANFNNVVAGSVANVDFYSNSLSSYQLASAMGNVREFTDSFLAGSNDTRFLTMGGSFNTSNTGMTNNFRFDSAQPWFSDATNTITNAQLGFRIAAVPEPTTIALAGIGILSLGGLEWMKRRKRRAVASARLADAQLLA